MKPRFADIAERTSKWGRREAVGDLNFPSLQGKSNEEDTLGDVVDASIKIERLKTWCYDMNRLGDKKVSYDFVYVDQGSFEKYPKDSFNDLVIGFTEYKRRPERNPSE